MEPNPYLETVRRIAEKLPAVTEGTSYGTPSFKVGGKFFARLREDGETLALKLGYEMREFLMLSNPDVYFITDHYLHYPAILIRLPAVDPDELREHIIHAWRYNAPKKIAGTIGN
ncbi:MmcQ/YjbR family DNA-binding protein [Paenibacillus sp. MBLB4367]|uniref:MmcQ/YjbR family DNA-binding protein n=1 Tax=Paenibacillus sp. MBLB4367 TaxID=3384767 RepID=UPI0039080871